MKVFIIGSINMDLVIKTNIMPESGETTIGKGFFKNAGGKGANQAVAISKAGVFSEMVGSVGNEFDDILVEGLNKYNVGTSFIKKYDDVSSGVAVIVVNDNDNRIIVDAGANNKITEEVVLEVLNNAKKGDYVLLQLEIPINVVEYTLKIAKEKELVTVINPAPADRIKKEYFKYIDYFIVNQSEAMYYTDIYPHTFLEAKEAVNTIRSLGVNKVIVTLGEQGSYYFDGETEVSTHAYNTENVDTTSAGDTYIGFFIASISQNNSIERSMDLASAAAALCISKAGAQQSIPSMEEVNDYLEKK